MDIKIINNSRKKLKVVEPTIHEIIIPLFVEFEFPSSIYVFYRKDLNDWGEPHSYRFLAYTDPTSVIVVIDIFQFLGVTDSQKLPKDIKLLESIK